MAEQGVQETAPVAEWAIVELMGHVRMAGLVSEEQHFGATLGRIDIPRGDTEFATQFFGGGSVYRISPCSEEVARAVAARNQPMPVQRWELPSPAEPAKPVEDHQFVPDDDDDCDVCGEDIGSAVHIATVDDTYDLEPF